MHHGESPERRWDARGNGINDRLPGFRGFPDVGAYPRLSTDFRWFYLGRFLRPSLRPLLGVFMRPGHKPVPHVVDAVRRNSDGERFRCNRHVFAWERIHACA